MLPRWAYGFWQSRQRYTNQKELLDVVGGVSQAQDPARQHRARLVLLEGGFLGLARVRQDALPGSEGHGRQAARAERAPHDLRVAEVLSRRRPTTRSSTPRASCTAGNVEAGALDWVGKGYKNSFYDPYSKPRATCTGARSTRSWTCSASTPGGWTPPSPICIRTSTSTRSRRASARRRWVRRSSSSTPIRWCTAAVCTKARAPRGPTRACSSSRARASRGIQRNAAAVWSGDIVSRWDDLYNQISAGVSIGYSGLPNWTFDIGGFAQREPLQHAEAGALRISRSGASSTCAGSSSARSRRCSARTANIPFREIFNLAPQGSEVLRQPACGTTSCAIACCRTPTRVAADTFHRDGTIMRGLAMDFADDVAARDVRDEYLFGKAFLVAPVYKYKARSRQVYLPAGADWYDFHTGAKHAGGQSVRGRRAARAHAAVRARRIDRARSGPESSTPPRSPARRSRCSCSRAPTAASTTTKTTA